MQRYFFSFQIIYVLLFQYFQCIRRNAYGGGGGVLNFKLGNLALEVSRTSLTLKFLVFLTWIIFNFFINFIKQWQKTYYQVCKKGAVTVLFLIISSMIISIQGVAILRKGNNSPCVPHGHGSRVYVVFSDHPASIEQNYLLPRHLYFVCGGRWIDLQHECLVFNLERSCATLQFDELN